MARVGLMSGAPAQETMEISKNFNQTEGIMLKQKPKDCLRNCLGCQGMTEYQMSNMDWQYVTNSTNIASEAVASMPDTLTLKEESNICLRCFWRDGRPLTFRATEGAEEGGSPVLNYEKPCGMPLYCTVPIPTSAGGDGGGGGGDGGGGGGGGQDTASCDVPCCFMLPSLSTHDLNGQELNKSQYICDAFFCVPKLMYFEGEVPIYFLAPDTCCGGCLIKPKGFCKKGMYQVPFYFRDPESKEKLTNANGANPQISKVWAGLKKECCYTADSFATFWPDGCNANRKAGLVGLNLLLDFTVFEKQGVAAPA